MGTCKRVRSLVVSTRKHYQAKETKRRAISDHIKYKDRINIKEPAWEKIKQKNEKARQRQTHKDKHKRGKEKERERARKEDVTVSDRRERETSRESEFKRVKSGTVTVTSKFKSATIPEDIRMGRSPRACQRRGGVGGGGGERR